MGEDRIAPEGKLWVCCVCGKTSRDLYGDGSRSGWDESCALNARLYDERLLVRRGGRVCEVMEPDDPRAGR